MSPSWTGVSARGTVIPAMSSAPAYPVASGGAVQDVRGAARVVAVVVGQDHVRDRRPVEADPGQRRRDRVAAALHARVHDRRLAAVDEDVGGDEAEVDAAPGRSAGLGARARCGQRPSPQGWRSPMRPARRRHSSRGSCDGAALPVAAGAQPAMPRTARARLPRPRSTTNVRRSRVRDRFTAMPPRKRVDDRYRVAYASAIGPGCRRGESMTLSTAELAARELANLIGGWRVSLGLHPEARFERHGSVVWISSAIDLAFVNGILTDGPDVAPGVARARGRRAACPRPPVRRAHPRRGGRRGCGRAGAARHARRAWRDAPGHGPPPDRVRGCRRPCRTASSSGG